MIEIHEGVPSLSGPEGSLPVREDDEITLKLATGVPGDVDAFSASWHWASTTSKRCICFR